MHNSFLNMLCVLLVVGRAEVPGSGHTSILFQARDIYRCTALQLALLRIPYFIPGFKSRYLDSPLINDEKIMIGKR